MRNEERLKNIFSISLGVALSNVKDDLQYNTIPEWDSIAHMALVAALESEFDIMMDTDDIIDMDSVKKAKEILEKYDIIFS
jgi:acyl carrier protein